MLIRNCAGGVVFFEEQVFLLQNDKQEWVLPKGAIRGDALAQDVAKDRVRSEAGLEADIVVPVGDTSYEFYSIKRCRPVCNRIHWFIMKAQNASYRVATEQGFLDGGFFPIEEALERITYTQDQSLVRLAYDKFQKYS